ncbi:hypothetical protein ABK040_011097 [Willaertia magna]
MFTTRKTKDIAHYWLFDFDKCMQNENIYNLFKQHLNKENEGKFLQLLEIYKHMTNNPSYYESTLYSEKKREIHYRLKEDSFIRFIRSDSFRNYLSKMKEKYNTTGNGNNGYGYGSTSTAGFTTNANHHSPRNRKLVIVPEDNNNNSGIGNDNNTTQRSPRKEPLTIDSSLTLLNNDFNNLNFNNTNHSSIDMEDYLLKRERGSLPELNSTVNNNNTQNIIYQNHKSVGFIDSNNNTTKHLLEYTPYHAFLETLGEYADTSLNLVFPYMLKDFKASSLTWKDLRFLEQIEKDSPYWKIVEHVENNNTNIKVNNSFHLNFLKLGGGDAMALGNHAKHLWKTSTNVSPTDLPLDKVLKFKTVYYVPFSHHDAFHILETNKVHVKIDRQHQAISTGRQFFVPEEGIRDFYCYDDKLVVPGLKLNKNRILNMLGTNFYDEKNQRYVVIVKSQGYEEAQSDDISYGLKFVSFTKITNNLTRITECGFVYMGGLLTKEVFTTMLLKGRIVDMYQNLVKLSDDYCKDKNGIPKLNEEDDGYRVLCLKENAKIINK